MRSRKCSERSTPKRRASEILHCSSIIISPKDGSIPGRSISSSKNRSINNGTGYSTLLGNARAHQVFDFLAHTAAAGHFFDHLLHLGKLFDQAIDLLNGRSRTHRDPGPAWAV